MLFRMIRIFFRNGRKKKGKLWKKLVKEKMVEFYYVDSLMRRI